MKSLSMFSSLALAGGALGRLRRSAAAATPTQGRGFNLSHDAPTTGSANGNNGAGAYNQNTGNAATYNKNTGTGDDLQQEHEYRNTVP